MSITLTRSSPLQKVPAGDGYSEIRGVAAFVGSDTSGTLDIPFATIESVLLQAVGGAASSALWTIPSQLGSLAATTAFNFIMPQAGTLTLAKFVGATTISNHSANYWGLGLVNKNTGSTMILNTTAPNTTQTITGSGTITQYVPLTLVQGNASAQAVATSDVLEFTATKNGSATTITEGTLLLGFTTTAIGAEDITVDSTNLADGFISRDANGRLTINRRGAALTSGLSFSFRITGRS